MRVLDRGEFNRVLKTLEKKEDYSFVLLIPSKVLEATFRNFYIYTFDELSKLESILLSLISLGVSDVFLLGYMLGDLDKEVLLNIVKNMEKKNLIETHEITVNDLLREWENLLEQRLLNQEILEDVRKKISGEKITVFSLTENGRYALNTKIIRKKKLVRILKIKFDKDFKAIIDFNYNDIFSKKEDNKTLLLNRLKNALGVDPTLIFKDEKLRREWLVPEDIVEPADEKLIVVDINKTTDYYRILLDANLEIKDIEISYESESKFGPKSNEKLEDMKAKVIEKVKKEVIPKLKKFLDERKNQKNYLEFVINDDKELSFFLTDKEAKNVLKRPSILVESALDNKITLKIDFKEFIALPIGSLRPLLREIAEVGIREFMIEKLDNHEGEFINTFFNKELLEESKKIRNLWKKRIDDISIVWNRCLNSLRDHLWKEGRYYLVYKLNSWKDVVGDLIDE